MYEDAELILAARHVTKKYPASNHRTLVANRDISLNFYRGKTLGLVGESGCGKSTFMRMMVSLEAPTEGEILYRGQDITKLRGEALRQHRQRIQMVFQDPTAAFHPKMRPRLPRRQQAGIQPDPRLRPDLQRSVRFLHFHRLRRAPLAALCFIFARRRKKSQLPA